MLENLYEANIRKTPKSIAVFITALKSDAQTANMNNKLLAYNKQ